MTDHSIHHATIVLERVYNASPTHVFEAWSDPQALQAWGNPGEGWVSIVDRFDFSVGGGELTRFGPKGGDMHVNETLYLDIVPERRIISAGSIKLSGVTFFVGMLSIDFQADGKGCRLIMTEQGAYLDGHDKPENHEAGWSEMLDKLGEYLRDGA